MAVLPSPGAELLQPGRALGCPHYARQIQTRLAQAQADLLLCPENAIPLARVCTTLPTVLWTDALLGSLVDFYPHLSNLCLETRRRLQAVEQAALDRCDRVILTSQWAAQSAMALYGLPAAKIRIIPRGGQPRPRPQPASVRSRHRPARPISLLAAVFGG